MSRVLTFLFGFALAGVAGWYINYQQEIEYKKHIQQIVEVQRSSIGMGLLGDIGLAEMMLAKDYDTIHHVLAVRIKGAIPEVELGLSELAPGSPKPRVASELERAKELVNELQNL